MTTDLSTLASVAISDSKTDQKTNNSTRNVPVALHSTVSQDLPIVSTEGDSAVPGLSVSISSPIASVSSPLLPVASVSPSSCTNLSATVSAVTTSVIQSSNSVDSNPCVSQASTVNIPTTHAIFNQGISGSNSASVCYTTSTVVCNNSSPLSPRNMPPANVTTTFAQVSSIVSPAVSSPSPMLPIIDKSKIKQERLDKYKPKSPLSASPIRPIVPAPTQLIPLSPGIAAHSGIDINNHGGVASSLKPIQPKPTIMGEPTVNPALDSLKKDKSKHKKKSKDKDKERDKKLPSLQIGRAHV